MDDHLDCRSGNKLFSPTQRRWLSLSLRHPRGVAQIFSTKIFSRIFRFYKAIEEYDILLGGFFADVTTLKSEKRKLTAEDISYLARKKDRVIALGNILTKTPISDLEQIPPDYEGKIASKTIIR